MAQVHGFPKAARVYDVHPETIKRAARKIAANDALRAKVEAKRQEFAEEWRPQALRVLRIGFDTLENLFEQAKGKPEYLRDVAGAVHLINEKIIAVDALPNTRRQPAKPAQSTHVGRDLPNSNQGAPAPSAGGIGGSVGGGRPGATAGNGVPTGTA
jgi:hypothetical protein